MEKYYIIYMEDRPRKMLFFINPQRAIVVILFVGKFDFQRGTNDRVGVFKDRRV